MAQEKPGFVGKMKDMVTGHKPAGTATSNISPPAVVAPQSKKQGIVEKVKEKIPGTHEHDAAKAATTLGHTGATPGAAYPATTPGATHTDAAGYPGGGLNDGAVPKKEGLVAKVKDKLHI
eukprot:TRINITY_DN1003_c0_g1_i1.p1 TRINITY_DN1003_c0_g1~~TRINITY_DN1003_c0_g1_i1.p1  ORF type:complete len:120 (+),score=25.91 TRINITY_DN1003_c0_g1_i1:183-542(+)